MSSLLFSLSGWYQWAGTVLVAILAVWLCIAAVLHILNRKFEDPLSKIFWLIIVIIFPIFGALIYRAWT